MQRPIGITVTAILMVVNVICDVTLSLTAPYVHGSTISPRGPSNALIIVHFVLFAFVLAQCVFVGFYWLGRAWARWAILVGCLFYLMGLRSVVTEWHRRHDIAALTFASAILAVYLLWYMHTERVRRWFARPKGVREPAMQPELTGR